LVTKSRPDPPTRVGSSSGFWNVATCTACSERGCKTICMRKKWQSKQAKATPQCTSKEARGPELWCTFLSPMGLRQLAAAARRTADPPPRYDVFGGRRLPGMIMPPNFQQKCTHPQLAACRPVEGGGRSSSGALCRCVLCVLACQLRAPPAPPVHHHSPQRHHSFAGMIMPGCKST
jgi:hypothetical protein